MATVQSGVGRIRMFEDFFGAEVPVALSTDVENLGQFRIGGEGIEETSTNGGLVILDSDGLNGIAELTTGDTDLDTIAIMSANCFDVALMAPMVLETRLRLPALSAKAVFIGFSDTAADDVDLGSDVIDYSATTTVTLQTSHICGFYLSSQFGDSEDWHAIHKGGTTTAVTATGDIDLDNVAVTDEFQIFRLEIDPNGTARWYIDGKLLKTLSGAVSTTADLLSIVAVTENGGAAAKMEVDYVLVEANRDWTV